MPVVSNTSPILNLAIVNQLVLLHQQFGEIRLKYGVSLTTNTVQSAKFKINFEL
jgi:predicted nucleic acid-binding protein